MNFYEELLSTYSAHLPGWYSDLPAIHQQPSLQRRIQGGPPLEYACDPRLLEQNLDDFANLLERLFSLQSQYNSLRSKAAEAALASALFHQTADDYEHLERNAGALDEAQLAASTSQELATSATNSNHALSDYLVKQADGAKSMAERRTKSENERRQLVTRLWKLRREQQAALDLRYSTAGSPFNFREQAESLAEVYALDYVRTFALAIALQDADFMADDHLPDRASLDEVFTNLADPLPALITYQKRCAAFLSRLRQREVEFVHILSLRTALKPDGSSYFNEQQFKDALAANAEGDFSFTLEDPFAGLVSRLRLLAVSVSVDHEHSLATDANISLYRSLFTKAVVILPNNAGVPFDNVKTTDLTRDDAYAFGPTILNVDPRGLWSVKIGPRMFTSSAATDYKRPKVTDIKLHLRLRGEVSGDLAEWNAAKRPD